MLSIVNLEGTYGKQAVGEIIHRDRFVGRLSAIVEGGVQRIIVRDLDRNIVATHTQPKGQPWGGDQMHDWINALEVLAQ